MKIQEGQFVYSKAGHDAGEIGVIIKVLDEYVFYVNGETKTIEKPKKKKVKHLQPTGFIDNEFISLKKENRLTDEYIKHSIKNYKKDYFA